jgi:hypothetical protein
LITFVSESPIGTDTTADDTERWAEALVEAHKQGRLVKVQIERIDDEPARTSPHAAALRAVGFADGYKGLTLR